MPDAQIQNFPDQYPVVLTTYVLKEDGTKEIIPLKCKKNSDGSWSLDISATVEAGQINIGAVKLEDNDDSNIKLDIVLDSDLVEPYPAGIYILGVDETGKNRLLNLQQINSKYHLLCLCALKNRNGIQINPATEETLDAILNKLNDSIKVSIQNWISSIAVSNFPGDYPDTVSQSILDSIYDLLNTKTISVKDRPSQNVIVYDEALSVAPNTLTTVVSYINTGSLFYLDSIVGTGTFACEYFLYINNNIVIGKRSTAANMNIEHNFYKPLIINTGDTVEVKVKHYAPGNRSFYATILGSR